jgi:hypothetical protein
LGVNIPATVNGNTRPTTAGAIFKTSGQALGAPNFAARIPETIAPTASGMTKQFDILLQAAPEIITAMPNAARCKLAGQPTQMFDAQGLCTMNGIACLQGYAATDAQKALCDQVAQQGSTPAFGQTLAVATILAAAHTCE